MHGTLLDDRYRILQKVGAGGMAEVWLGDDLIGRRKVAVKVMPASLASSPEYVRRFRREYDVCVAIDHPNVVKIFGFGQTPDGGLYYAMEYLPCKTLEDLIEERGRLRESMALQVVLQMARAFEHLHPTGLVHRDLKPSNVMVEDNGRVIIMDFGLVHDDTKTQLTATGTIMGTPQYMSPELLMGEGVDGRSDIFQLGAIAHECLTGSKAFDGRTVPEVAQRILAGVYRTPREVLPEISTGWDAFVRNCLAVKREDRYPDAPAVLVDLQGLMLGQPVPLRPGAAGPRASESVTEDLTPGPPAKVDTLPGGFAPTGARPDGRTLTEGKARSRTLPPRPGTRGEGGVSSSTPRLGPVTTSSLSLSTLGTPPPRRTLAVGGAMVVTALFVAAFILRGGGGYTVEGLQATAGVTDVVLDWTSERPYPSLVVVDGTPPRRVPGDSPDPVTTHRVRVTGLAEGTSYAVRVVYPDETTSLPQTVATTRFELDIQTLVRGKGGARLTWRPVPAGPARVRLQMGAGGSSEVLPAVLAPDGTCAVDVGELSSTTSDVVVDTTVGGAVVTRNLSRVLADQVRGLLTRLARFDPEAILKGAYDGMEGSVADKFDRDALDPLPGESDEAFAARKKAFAREVEARDAAGKTKARALLEGRLDASPSLADYRRLRDLAPLVLGTRLLPYDMRCAVHERLAAFVGLVLYSMFEDAPIRTLDPLPDLGDFALTAEPMEPFDGRTVVHEGSADDPVIGVEMPWVRPKPLGTWETTFAVPPPSTLERVQLCFRFENLRNTVLRCRVGSGFSTTLYGSPLIKCPVKGFTWICQSIPAEALREGDNRLEVSVRDLFARMPKKSSRVGRLEVRWRTVR